MAARWEKFQQLPIALAHAALSMAANSALKPEAPRILTLGSMKPYDVTPTTALRVRLRVPVGAGRRSGRRANFLPPGPAARPAGHVAAVLEGVVAGSGAAHTVIAGVVALH